MTGIIHVSMGGPNRRISVNGRVFIFEDHPYCGPIALNKRGEGLAVQPKPFLHAVTQWAQQGRKIGEDGLCTWFHDPEPIIERRGRRNFVVGEKPAQRGS